MPFSYRSNYSLKQTCLTGQASQFVGPFIGTDGLAILSLELLFRFGMMQLSPDTTHGLGWLLEGTIIPIIAFTDFRTHSRGTGCSRLWRCDVMPLWARCNSATKVFYHFQKENEKASAGYYSVFLDDAKVEVELAPPLGPVCTTTFPKTNAANVILDLTHRDKSKEGEIRIARNSKISGYRISSAWAGKQIHIS
ncbi:MAG: hypothetical protein IPH78_13290 [Bacteroidetes bacterium]|nr:hypothetical protein [Bacteroidota bacterium]